MVTLRTYILISIYRPIYRPKNAIFDSPYYLLATISDHIPRKRYHQHNEMKSANSLFCQFFQAFVEILLCNVVQRWSICLISYVETQYISTGVGIKNHPFRRRGVHNPTTATKTPPPPPPQRRHHDRRHKDAATAVHESAESATIASPTIASPTIASPTIVSPTIASPTIATPTIVPPTIIA